MSKNLIKIKYFSLFLITCSILMLSLLVGPRVPDDEQRTHCVDNIKIGGPFGISLNCDSSEFMLLANNPELLLEKDNIRQSRPGLIYVAALLVKITKSITPYFNNNLKNTEITNKANKTNQSRMLKNGLAFGAYVFTNNGNY